MRRVRQARRREGVRPLQDSLLQSTLPAGALEQRPQEDVQKIQRAGGAEQFYADAKFKEAADEAVAACAAQGVPQDVECFAV